MNQQADNKTREIEITTDDLPLHCPTPAMMLWNCIRGFFFRLKQRAKRYALIAARTIRLKAALSLGTIKAV